MFDMEKIVEKYDIIMMMVIININEYVLVEVKDSGMVMKGN